MRPRVFLLSPAGLRARATEIRASAAPSAESPQLSGIFFLLTEAAPLPRLSYLPFTNYDWRDELNQSIHALVALRVSRHGATACVPQSDETRGKKPNPQYELNRNRR